MKSYDFENVSKNPTVFFWHPDNKIVKAVITGCDFDKRVDMITEDGEEINYKWGYVYKTYDDAKQNVDFDYENSFEDLCNLPECINPRKMLLSNKDYSMYKKCKRKEDKETGYYVYAGEVRHTFKTLKRALLFFQDLKDDGLLGSEKHGHLLELEDGCLVTYESRKGRFPIKSRYLGKLNTYKQWRK